MSSILTKQKSWWAAALFPVLLGLTVWGFFAMPALVPALAPMKHQYCHCILCGEGWEENWVCDIKTSEKPHPWPCVGWVNQVAALPHEHRWSCYADLFRDKWGGPQNCICDPWTPPVMEIFRLRESAGEQRAVELLNEWHQLVQSKPQEEWKRRELYDTGEKLLNPFRAARD